MLYGTKFLAKHFSRLNFYSVNPKYQYPRAQSTYDLSRDLPYLSREKNLVLEDYFSEETLLLDVLFFHADASPGASTPALAYHRLSFYGGIQSRGGRVSTGRLGLVLPATATYLPACRIPIPALHLSTGCHGSHLRHSACKVRPSQTTKSAVWIQRDGLPLTP